jgi:hypothetical protein
MPVFVTLTPPSPDPPSLTAMKARFARKAERVLSDPAFRAQQDVQWWHHDLQAIRKVEKCRDTNSRLDPRKITVEVPHSDDYDQRFRFRRWPLERRFWLDHLPLVESSEVRIERWEQCGKRAALWLDSANDRYVLRSDTCKLRICPACRRRYQFAAIARIRDLLQDMKPRTWQFITLTVRHTKAPLAQQADFLKASFRRLRQRTVWKQSVAHGYAVLEIAYNTHKDEWHPHLHVLARCRYVDWRDLRKAWIAVTDGSSVIDCGYVRNQGSACDYVAKYLAKPPSLLDLPTPQRIAEYYAAIQNARFLMPFGRPPKPPQRPCLDTPAPLKFIGRLTQLHELARDGNTEAAQVLRKLVHRDAAADKATEPEHQHRIHDDACHFDPADPLRAPP